MKSKMLLAYNGIQFLPSALFQIFYIQTEIVTIASAQLQVY